MFFQIFVWEVKKMPGLGGDTLFEPKHKRLERPETAVNTPVRWEELCA
jgi:hypothetical protein